MGRNTLERAVLLVLLVAGTLWVAALFGVGSGTLSGEPPQQSPYAPGNDEPDTAGKAQIIISGFDFGDATTVSVGDEVTVVNRDGSAHTWTSSDGAFDSGVISGGGSFSFTFDTAGEFAFFCAIHPQMTGAITVTG